jgi:hypothetical protein
MGCKAVADFVCVLQVVLGTKQRRKDRRVLSNEERYGGGGVILHPRPWERCGRASKESGSGGLDSFDSEMTATGEVYLAVDGFLKGGFLRYFHELGAVNY